MTETRLLPRIVLIACGSFSPPTPMHFRMFEIARDYFEMQGSHQVVGGIVSPTHDEYGKKGLAHAKHRYAMVKLALQTSTWIRVSDWEITQSQWSRTRSVLHYYQNYINNYVNAPEIGDSFGPLPGWLPNNLRERHDRVQVKLLCGADLLESFSVPGLWAEEDIEDIVLNHGLVVISRAGANPDKFIFESDILSTHQRHIILITNWVSNEISSTVIRRLLSRGQSVKYLIDDLVLEYIKANSLFNFKTKHISEPTHPPQSSFNIEYINQVDITASSNENTPSDDDGDSDHLDEERMDETDNSIKNKMTSINLDNRTVFCCIKDQGKHVRLKTGRKIPGQAVPVIRTERILVGERVPATERKIKKVRMSVGENV